MVEITLDGEPVTVVELRALALCTWASQQIGTLKMDGRPARLALEDGALVVEALLPDWPDGERRGDRP